MNPKILLSRLLEKKKVSGCIFIAFHFYFSALQTLRRQDYLRIFLFDAVYRNIITNNIKLSRGTKNFL